MMSSVNYLRRNKKMLEVRYNFNDVAITCIKYNLDEEETLSAIFTEVNFNLNPVSYTDYGVAILLLKIHFFKRRYGV